MEKLKNTRMCIVIKHPGSELTDTLGKEQFCYKCGYINHYTPNFEAILKKDQAETSNAKFNSSSTTSQPPDI